LQLVIVTGEEGAIVKSERSGWKVRGLGGEGGATGKKWDSILREVNRRRAAGATAMGEYPTQINR